MTKPSIFENISSEDFTATERRSCSVLIIEPDKNDRTQMLNCHKELEFKQVSAVEDYPAAENRLMERNFSHLIVPIIESTESAAAFVARIHELDPSMVIVVSSLRPDLDQIFDVLTAGARGFLVKPFNTESALYALSLATKGESFSKALLNSPDRNQALITIMMNSLDKLAATMQHSKSIETVRKEIPQAMIGLHHSVDLALSFAEDGETGYLERIEDLFIERSRGPASRLGRLRKNLAARRKERTTAEDEEGTE